LSPGEGVFVAASPEKDCYINLPGILGILPGEKLSIIFQQQSLITFRIPETDSAGDK
jgi:hypothetical protein